MKLQVQTYSQRNSVWGSIYLGNNTALPYNIYNYGCLITSLGNYVNKTPDQVNTLLKNNSGFVSGGNFVWNKSTVLGLTQQYLSSRCMNIDFYTTELQQAKDFIKSGYPVLLEVDFNPATDQPEMHFVLGAGVSDNNELLVVDPWEGQWETWSDGAARRNIYQFRKYDKKIAVAGTAPIDCDPNWRVERDTNWNLYQTEKNKVLSLQTQLSQKDTQCKNKFTESINKIKVFLDTVI